MAQVTETLKTAPKNKEEKNRASLQQHEVIEQMPLNKLKPSVEFNQTNEGS
jgi:hypothetical protein